MKLFIDSANLEEIRTSVSWGIVDGATTNPSLVAKEEGVKFEALAKEICGMVPGPVSLEVVSLESKGMIEEGKKLSRVAENVVVKVPMTVEGIKAVKELEKSGIKTNVTLVFSVNQAMLAAKVGASYISPFIGRLDDIGHSGADLLAEIKTMLDNYGYKSQIIVASVRHSDHVKQAELIGCHIATVPFKVLEKLYQHALTDKGIEAFLSDWKKVKK